MTDLPSLIVFGSLNTWPSAGELQELRRSILQQDHLSHVREAICRLPELWETLLANNAALDTVQGAAAAEQLATWVSSGGALSRGTTQNNILSLPLTILSHLCDYMTYLQQTGFSHSTILDHVVKAAGVQGFCAGLLSALAVAGSRDEGSVGLHGALSVRLAFAIGAYVDLDSLRNGQTSCLALRWKSPNSLASIQKVLEKYNSVRRQRFLNSSFSVRHCLCSLLRYASAHYLFWLHLSPWGHLRVVFVANIHDMLYRQRTAINRQSVCRIGGAASVVNLE